MKTVEVRYTVIFVVLIAVIALITEQSVEHFVAPQIQATEVVLQKVNQVILIRTSKVSPGAADDRRT